MCNIAGSCYWFCFILLVAFTPARVPAQNNAQANGYARPDTLRSFVVRRKPPYLYSLRLKHKETTLGNKTVRAGLYISGFNIAMGAYLMAAPEEVSKWHKSEKFRTDAMVKQYGKTFTASPVIDDDMFSINYLGHPYQGGFYYNTLRSQGATAWQSAVFCTGQSLLWEYAWEGGFEQPSIQDLVSTPLAGILVGELSHAATIKMSRDGFLFYEAVIVCLINPAFVLNNGIKVTRARRSE